MRTNGLGTVSSVDSIPKSYKRCQPSCPKIRTVKDLEPDCIQEEDHFSIQSELEQLSSFCRD